MHVSGMAPATGPDEQALPHKYRRLAPYRSHGTSSSKKPAASAVPLTRNFALPDYLQGNAEFLKVPRCSCTGLLLTASGWNDSIADSAHLSAPLLIVMHSIYEKWSPYSFLITKARKFEMMNRQV